MYQELIIGFIIGVNIGVLYVAIWEIIPSMDSIFFSLMKEKAIKSTPLSRQKNRLMESTKYSV